MFPEALLLIKTHRYSFGPAHLCQLALSAVSLGTLLWVSPSRAFGTFVPIDDFGLGVSASPLSVAGKLLLRDGIYERDTSIEVYSYNLRGSESYCIPMSLIQQNKYLHIAPRNPHHRSQPESTEVDAPLVELEFTSSLKLIAGFIRAQQRCHSSDCGDYSVISLAGTT